MSIKNKKKTKIITSTVVGVSAVATGLSLGLSLSQTNSINKLDTPDIQNARASVMDNLLPEGSSQVSIPDKFSHNGQDSHWMGKPVNKTLDPNDYFANDVVD